VTAGTLIGRTFSVWSRNVWRFAGVTVAIQVPSLLVSWALGSPLLRASANPFAPAPEVTAFVFSGRYWLMMLATWLFGLVQMGALTAGAIQYLAGRSASAGEMLSAGLGRAGPIFLAGLLGVLAADLGFFLLIVPGIVVGLMFSLTVPVVMAERLGPVRSLGRSRALTKGHRWRLLGLFLVVLATTATPAMLAAVLSGGVPYLTTVLNLAISAVLGSIAMVAPAVAYHDLRVAKEGADTAQLARIFE
jgi:hypothetical protein